MQILSQIEQRGIQRAFVFIRLFDLNGYPVKASIQKLVEQLQLELELVFRLESRIPIDKYQEKIEQGYYDECQAIFFENLNLIPGLKERFTDEFGLT